MAGLGGVGAASRPRCAGGERGKERRRGRKKKNGEEKRKWEKGKRKRKRKREREKERERERCVGADHGERSRVADRRPSGAGWDGGEEKEGGNGRRKRNDRTLNELGCWDGGKIQNRV